MDAEQVQRLITEQFPQWAALPIRPVDVGGWDNATFHLGDDMVVRLPTASEYSLAVAKEHEWLPVLASQLPLPIPTPLAKGEPGAGYPFPWSIYSWLDGETASFDEIADPVGFADDLADFVAALRSVDVAGGPRPGKHNWFRGGTLKTFEPLAQRALRDLAGHVDTDLAREIWADSLGATWDGVDVWFHGDLAQGNLLLAGGELAAVIDFGTCGVGDPACDLAIAWTLLTPDGREVFRERLGIDDATWARGRGWALWKTLTMRAGSLGESDDDAVNDRRVLEEIFAEYAAFGSGGRAVGA
ncbi:aminoglycoside phosphotransferase [Janibacter sp. HTCC2649]|nr:aminoglycoside phosphotransferase [Janibacter sp. HTCC2649]